MLHTDSAKILMCSVPNLCTHGLRHIGASGPGRARRGGRTQVDTEGNGTVDLLGEEGRSGTDGRRRAGMNARFRGQVPQQVPGDGRGGVGENVSGSCGCG